MGIKYVNVKSRYRPFIRIKTNISETHITTNPMVLTKCIYWMGRDEKHTTTEWNVVSKMNTNNFYSL